MCFEYRPDEDPITRFENEEGPQADDLESSPFMETNLAFKDVQSVEELMEYMKRVEHERDAAGSPQRVPDQPPPKLGNPHPAVADMVAQDVLLHMYGSAYDKDVNDVIADIEERKQVGIARYGTPLRGFDGRDNWIDLYQEILDALNYMRKAIYEVTAPISNERVTPDLAQMITDYKTILRIAVEIRGYMNRRRVDTAPVPG
jgi:hypothetical protein